MDAESLLAETAALIESPVVVLGEKERGWEATNSYQTTIQLPDGRTQKVNLSLVEHDLEMFQQRKVVLHVDSFVGPMNSTIDAEYLLECTRKLVMSRICLCGDKDNLIGLEGRLPLELATPPIVAALILEVAYHADALEKDLFEVDVY